MKKLVFIIPIIVILALAGIVVYVLFINPLVYIEFDDGTGTDGAPLPAEPAHAAEETAAAEPAEESTPEFSLEPWGVMYPLDSKAVNLAEPGGLRYLQAAIVLEFRPLATTTDTEGQAESGGGGHGEAEAGEVDPHADFKAEIDQRRPVIDDIVMTILSSKTFNEIATVEGKQALKEELMTAINDALGYPAVMNVYFTEFIVQ
jgi:flagellar FliL protein